MKYVLFLLTSLYAGILCSWNAEGHRIVAQIAENHLTPSALIRFKAYNQSLDELGYSLSLSDSAVWLDRLRGRFSRASGQMHYIDLPIFEDGKREFRAHRMNAVIAVQQAHQLLLETDASILERAIALRILLHVVGDLHQPLHAATRVSLAYPLGDRGGNLVILPKNRIAKNLHAYWDKGGGYLASRGKFHDDLNEKVRKIEARWPCSRRRVQHDPWTWAYESYVIAMHDVYQFEKTGSIDPAYSKGVRIMVQQRLAVAGCRLAAMLNDVDDVYSKQAERG